MKCRMLVHDKDDNDNKRATVVWFKSYGKNADGTARKVDDNFSYNQQGVADSLTQRLSVIRRELWYNVTYGLPLFEKNNNKAMLDANVLSIVNQHPDVISVLSFESNVSGHHYSCQMNVQSRYGVIDVYI